MASPIGHVMAGVGLAGAVGGGLGVASTPALWAGAALASCLPDLDLLPSLWGVPYRRTHRQASHSLLVLVPILALSWTVARAFAVPADWRLTAAWTAALLSHLVLDVFCTGPVLGRQGHGVPLFWPLSCRRFFVRDPMVPEVDLLHNATPGLVFRACVQEITHLGPAAVAMLILGHLL